RQGSAPVAGYLQGLLDLLGIAGADRIKDGGLGLGEVGGDASGEGLDPVLARGVQVEGAGGDPEIGDGLASAGLGACFVGDVFGGGDQEIAGGELLGGGHGPGEVDVLGSRAHRNLVDQVAHAELDAADGAGDGQDVAAAGPGAGAELAV